MFHSVFTVIDRFLAFSKKSSVILHFSMSFFVGGRKRSDLVEASNMNSKNHNDWVQELNIVSCNMNDLYFRMKIKM